MEINLRFAVISDIHSNLEALTAVLKDIHERNVDEIICLGDIVGYGPNPNECLELIRSNCSVCIKGNHDAATLESEISDTFNVYARLAIDYTRERLNDENLSFLESLPLIETRNNDTFVHSSPYYPDNWLYVFSEYDAMLGFASFDEDCCYIGHSHIPKVFVENTEKHIFERNEIEVHFEDDNRYIINSGSVGQPRDGDSRAAYGFIDSGSKVYQLIRVDYDYLTTQEKMRMNSLPEFLINRLASGN